MLWKKESNESSALYTDIFSSHREVFEKKFELFQNNIGCTQEKKCDATSMSYRAQGNGAFSVRSWWIAMELYNDALRYAQTGSPNISLALANRSACFFHLKMYKECLIDIELAKEFGYPDNLMWKLVQRKQDCLKSIEGAAASGPVDDFGRKLSFEADEKFSCMANVLQINNNDGSFSIVAKDDIGVGKTICLENPFISYLYEKTGTKCNICLRERTNLRPCKNCIVMFCSDECERHYLHEFECNLKFWDNSQHNGAVLEKARLIFSIMNHFEDANELIVFVEQTINNDKKELPDSLSDFRSKYRTFLKSSQGLRIINSHDFLIFYFMTYAFIMTVPKVKAWFSSLFHRRFLAHLIMHHAGITERHVDKFGVNSKTTFLSHMGMMNQFFSHTCVPNILYRYYSGSRVFITIRPIKKGDQLRICYVDPLKTKEERQQELMERYQINCDCIRCNGFSSVTIAQREQIKLDPDFREIVNFNVKTLCDSSDNNGQKIIDKCIAFLEKYNNIIWCNEIEQILNMFIEVIRNRLSPPKSYYITETSTNDGTISKITNL